MRRVVITGATGFLGSHLTEHLVRSGADVTVIVRDTLGSISWLEEKLDVIKADITQHVPPIHEASTIFHLAAISHVARSIENPRPTFEANTIGTFNVLEGVRRSDSVEKFVLVSTAHVYGALQYLPVDEKHPTYSREPYSASKLAAEGFTSAYNKSYGIPMSIARLFNVYGPRQALDFVIPTIIKQMVEQNVITLGNLTPTRDFTYVDDVIRALILIAKYGDGIYNVGSGKETSIRFLVESIAEILGQQIDIVIKEEQQRSSAVEIERMQAAISRLSSLGWKPEITLLAGLKKTVEWFRGNL